MRKSLELFNNMREKNPESEARIERENQAKFEAEKKRVHDLFNKQLEDFHKANADAENDRAREVDRQKLCEAWTAKVNGTKDDLNKCFFGKINPDFASLEGPERKPLKEGIGSSSAIKKPSSMKTSKKTATTAKPITNDIADEKPTTSPETGEPCVSVKFLPPDRHVNHVTGKLMSIVYIAKARNSCGYGYVVSFKQNNGFEKSKDIGPNGTTEVFCTDYHVGNADCHGYAGATFK
jgi:hypothetical protein